MGTIIVQLKRGAQVIRTYPIQGDSCTIGSGRGCAIRTAGDDRIRGLHATIYREEGALSLVPEPGAEVVVDGEVVDFAILQPDTEVQVGRLRFSVFLGSVAGDRVSAAVEPPAVPPAKDDGSGDWLAEAVVEVDDPAAPDRQGPGAVSEETSGSTEGLQEGSGPGAATQESSGPDEALAEGAAWGEPTDDETATATESVDWASELGYYFGDDEDDELTFAPPFDLVSALLPDLNSPGPFRPSFPPDTSGAAIAEGMGRAAGEASCVASLNRVVHGQLAESAGVLSHRPYRALSGELEAHLEAGDLTLLLGKGLTGTLQTRDGPQPLPPADSPRRLILTEGQAARIEGREGVYLLEIHRPAVVPAPQRLALNPRLLATLLVALLLHLAFGVIRLDVSSDAEEELPGEEIFAEVQLEKPETPDQPKKPPPPPPDATKMAEKAPDVSRRILARALKSVRDKPAEGDVGSLLRVLSKGSGTPGSSDNLKDLVSNIDAIAPVPGSSAGFSIAGAIAALPGNAVNVARSGGGGVISTLSGDQVAGAKSGVASLGSGRPRGKVRGKVTKMSSRAKIRGSLSRSEVTKVVNAHINQIQACYERALMKHAGLGGRIVFDWTVTPAGSVTGVRVRSSTLSSAQVAACISVLIRGWHFPKPKGGEVIITYPFLFRSM